MNNRCIDIQTKIVDQNRTFKTAVCPPTVTDSVDLYVYSSIFWKYATGPHLVWRCAEAHHPSLSSLQPPRIDPLNRPRPLSPCLPRDEGVVLLGGGRAAPASTPRTAPRSRKALPTTATAGRAASTTTITTPTRTPARQSSGTIGKLARASGRPSLRRSCPSDHQVIKTYKEEKKKRREDER